jgi:HK97 gp10 family phage protein
MATNQSLSRLQALLASLPAELKAPILAETFNQAEVLRREMIFRVPVREGAGGGTLRNSIRVEKGRKEMRVLVRAGGDPTKVHGYDYALAQEFGTQKQPAQPFFWISYRKRKAGIRRAMKQAAKDAIKANWRNRA